MTNKRSNRAKRGGGPQNFPRTSKPENKETKEKRSELAHLTSSEDEAPPFDSATNNEQRSKKRACIDPSMEVDGSSVFDDVLTSSPWAESTSPSYPPTGQSLFAKLGESGSTPNSATAPRDNVSSYASVPPVTNDNQTVFGNSNQPPSPHQSQAEGSTTSPNHMNTSEDTPTDDVDVFYASILVSDLLRQDETLSNLRNRLKFYLTEKYPTQFKSVIIRTFPDVEAAKFFVTRLKARKSMNFF